MLLQLLLTPIYDHFNMAIHSKQDQEKVYNGSIASGALLVPESRTIARLLLAGADQKTVKEAILKGNILQKRSPQTAKIHGSLIQKRLILMNPPHWEMVVQGHAALATQAVMAAAIKHSHLIGDFMQSVVKAHWQTFQTSLFSSDWHYFMENCAQLDPRVDTWTAQTRAKLKQVVFKILAESGYINNTKSCVLQSVAVEPELRHYLTAHSETYITSCMAATENG